MRTSAALLLAAATIVGCHRATTEPTGLLETEQWTEKADGGVVMVEVEVDENHPAFLVSAQTAEPGAYLSVEQIWDPSGDLVMSWEDWYYSNEWIGEPFFAWYPDVYLNWPIRAADGPLDPGTWTVVVTAVDDRWGYLDIDLDLSVQRKRDTDLSQGTVHAWVVYAKGVTKEPGVEDAVEQAVDEWRRIWEPYGLDLQVEYGDMPGLDTALPVPGEDSEELLKLSSRSNGEQIVLVIGETVDGDQWTYGMAGGIPGPLVPSERSAIAISWLVHAGEDGYESWDALDDTPTCSSQSSCEEQLGPNLMFPYSICDWDSCSVQETLTGDQVASSQRYAGAL